MGGGGRFNICMLDHSGSESQFVLYAHRLLLQAYEGPEPDCTIHDNNYYPFLLAMMKENFLQSELARM